MTEKHCWHPDKLLLRLWPSTLRRSEAAEGALQRHSPQALSLLFLTPAELQPPLPRPPLVSPERDSHDSTASTAQVSSDNTLAHTDPLPLFMPPPPHVENTLPRKGCWGGQQIGSPQ